MPFRCTYCGKPHCSDHRLPEAHMCPEKSKAAQARRQRELEGHPGVEIRGPGARASGSAKAGSWWERSLGRFEGKTALYMLGVMVAVFVLEHVVINAAGCSYLEVARGQCTAFQTAFVLDTGFLTKPWTLVTSIFAHNAIGLWHILLNGVILFFFGPLLEKRIGSRRFLGLVLVSGMLAGLGQVTFSAAFSTEASGVVGISGALLAIMGVLTLLGPNLTVLLYGIIPARLWVMTIVFVFLDLLLFAFQVGNIAHVAHYTGLALGLIVGKKLRDQGFKFPGHLGHINAGPRESAGRGGR